jgi:hypothetical protein
MLRLAVNDGKDADNELAVELPIQKIKLIAVPVHQQHQFFARQEAQVCP